MAGTSSAKTSFALCPAITAFFSNSSHRHPLRGADGNFRPDPSAEQSEIDLAAADATRMRHLLDTHSADAILQQAQTYVDFPLTRDARLAGWRRRTTADASLRLGAHAQRAADTWHAGGQPPLGRIDAATLHGLAALAQQHGDGTLRITPWQSVLLPDIRTLSVPVVLAALNALGLACDCAEAITHLIACAGSTGCAKSLADTKADALDLASTCI